MHLWKLSRPRFWFYLFGPYLLGAAALAHSPIVNADLISLTVYGLYFLLPANLLIYGINDLFDYETDILNAKKQGYEAVLAPSLWSSTWSWILALNAPFVIMAPWLLPPTAVLALLAFLFFGLGYSVPPLRAKTKPFLDAFFNILYVFPALVSFGFVGLPPLVLVIAGTCWCMAMHAFSAVPDIKADTAAGIATVATVLGKTKTITFCLFLYLLSGALSFQYLGLLAVALGSAYALLMLASLKSDEAKLFKIYKLFPFVNLTAGFLLTLKIILPLLAR